MIPPDELEPNMARILLIDDKPEILMRFGRALRDAGHTVESVETVSLGYGLLASETFDLIVCDNNVEHINEGLRLARLLRGNGATLPFILHTGDDYKLLAQEFDFEKYHVTHVIKAKYESMLVKQVALELS